MLLGYRNGHNCTKLKGTHFHENRESSRGGSRTNKSNTSILISCTSHLIQAMVKLNIETTASQSELIDIILILSKLIVSGRRLYNTSEILSYNSSAYTQFFH